MSARLLLVLFVLAGCRNEPPPTGWVETVDVETLAAPCRSMIGASFPEAPSSQGQRVLARGIDLDSPDIPEAVRDLSPKMIGVTEIDVNIELGHYPTGYGDELDRYGLVCSDGEFSGQFQRRDGSTFLRPLGSGVYAYDSIL